MNVRQARHLRLRLLDFGAFRGRNGRQGGGEVNRRFALNALALAILSPAFGVSAAAPRVTVFTNPSCGCCTGWVDYMKANGFSVSVTEVPDTSGPRKLAGIPEQLGSCHTARVGGYALEGHVPAADVLRLLKERPDAIGLAVPGMPVGSPGMEVPGGHKDRYGVLLVERTSGTRLWSRQS
jgi:hypothetical protein